MACLDHEDAPRAEKEIKVSSVVSSRRIDHTPVEADVASLMEKNKETEGQHDSKTDLQSPKEADKDTKNDNRRTLLNKKNGHREESVSSEVIAQSRSPAPLAEQQQTQQQMQQQTQQQQTQQETQQQQPYASAPPYPYDGYYYPGGGSINGNGSVGYAIPVQQTPRGVYQQTVPYGYSAGYPVIPGHPWPVQQAVVFSSPPSEPGSLSGGSPQWSTTTLVSSPPYVQPSLWAGGTDILPACDVGGVRVQGEMSPDSRIIPHPGPPIQMVPDGHGPEGCNLFIFHIPNEMSNVDLFNYFSPFGNVISARIMVDNETGRSRGFGFVSYDNPNSATEAIAHMNGLQVGHKRLKVQHKKDKGGGEEGYGPPDAVYGGRGGKGRGCFFKGSRGGRGRGARANYGSYKTAEENGVRLPGEHTSTDFADDLAGEIGDLHFGEESDGEDAPPRS